MAAWFALGRGGVLRAITYHTGRGLEAESLYAGVIYLVGKLSRQQVGWVYVSKSLHIAPEWGARWAALAIPVQALTLILTGWRFWRSGMTDGVRYSAAAILAFIITGKILSPQFLIWLFPFIVVLEGDVGKNSRRMFLLACLCTTHIYPGPGFVLILLNQAPAILMLNLRNALLLWLLGLLLFGRQQEKSEAPLP
jgi:hypothetical protein